MPTVKSRYVNTSNGYVKLYLSDGSVIEEHRFIMEKVLGRKLHYNEVVHHKDGNKKNNAVSNLEIQTRAHHASKHANKNARIEMVCSKCGKLFHRYKGHIAFCRRRGQENFYCSRACVSEALRKASRVE